MRKLILILLLIGFVYSQTFEKSKTCKACHPIIYKEYYSSAHRKSSIFNDKIHNSIWKIHPLKKANQYKCAKCHTPVDTKLLNDLKNKNIALPKNNQIQQNEPISCSYCHKIKDIKKNKIVNSNIISNKNKYFYSANVNQKDKKIRFHKESFLGFLKVSKGSPYHDIDYSNENFYNAKVCIGCHSHLKNKNDFYICKTEFNLKPNSNCITCHMPQVKGSATTIKITKTHAFHGFAGVRFYNELLKKYVKLDFVKNNNSFIIKIKNLAPHNLFLHPLRVGVLIVKIKRKNQIIKLKPIKFVKILAHNKKPSFPWMANSIFKDNMIKANETKNIKFNKILKKGDIVEVKFGYFLVNPKVNKKLKIINKEKNFKILKTKIFEVE